MSLGTPVRLLHLLDQLGMGGDAKNLLALIPHQRAWADVSVGCLDHDAGPRASEVQRMGVVVGCGLNDPTVSERWLDELRPDVVIFTRNGGPRPNETRLLGTLRRRGICSIEYNTFGRLDERCDSLIDGHLHLSRASLLRYARRRGVQPADLSDHQAVGYVVSPVVTPSHEEHQSARKELGVPARAFVVTRLVRPDLRKWSPLPVLAVRRARRTLADLHLVIRSAPPERAAWVRRMCGPHATLLPASIVDSDVRMVLAASDCVVNCSAIGETFGLAIAEAMVMALPVVVNSTPRYDNAQVELCEHMVTGIVANSVGSISAAFGFLHDHPELAKAMGTTGRKLVEEQFGGAVVERRIRQFIRERLLAIGSPVAARIPQPGEVASLEADETWATQFRQRERVSFPDGSGHIMRLCDRARLALLGLIDTLTYAGKAGRGEVLEVLLQRLRRGSIARD